MLSLQYLPEVEGDILSAFRWYEEKSQGLGEEFLRIAYANSEEVCANPELYREVVPGFRRRLMRRFPYAIYFRIQEGKVIVVGILHCARNPAISEKGLSDRSG